MASMIFGGRATSWKFAMKAPSHPNVTLLLEGHKYDETTPTHHNSLLGRYCASFTYSSQTASMIFEYHTPQRFS